MGRLPKVRADARGSREPDVGPSATTRHLFSALVQLVALVVLVVVAIAKTPSRFPALTGSPTELLIAHVGCLRSLLRSLFFLDSQSEGGGVRFFVAGNARER